MKVTPKIKEMFKEIEQESIKYANTPDSNKKYLKRLLHLFKNNLTEEEQIYIIAVILEIMHYRNIIADPDNVLMLHNIKLKDYTYIFLLSVAFMLIFAIIFKTDGPGKEIYDFFSNIFKILTF